MKKVLAVLLVLSLMAGMSSGEEFSAWNLDERVHPKLKQYFLAKPELVITAETLPALREALTLPHGVSRGQ